MVIFHLVSDTPAEPGRLHTAVDYIKDNEHLLNTEAWEASSVCFSALRLNSYQYVLWKQEAEVFKAHATWKGDLYLAIAN